MNEGPRGRLGKCWARLAATAGTRRARLAMAATGVYFAVQLAGLPGIGLTDDDDFYLPAGRIYAQWISRAVTGPFVGDVSAWTRRGVTDAWSCPACNREHPPFAKVAIGSGVHLLADKLGVLPDYQAGRLGIVLLSTILAYLVFRLVFDTYGALAALFATAALLTMPRFYFHSHVPTLDVAVAFTYFLAAYAFWRARRSFGWGIFAGVAFGLALLTKVNAPFALAPLGIFWLWKLKGTKVIEGNLRLPPTSVAFPAMLVIGPILFLVLWPRLWFDTFRNLTDYLQFHLKHYGIFFYYFGTIYGDVFAPWHAPFVMAAITTPLVTVALALGGIGAAARDIVRRVRDSLQEEQRDLAVLLLLNAATCIGIVAFLKVPKYGGVKLFLPFFPFLAIFAGIALARLLDLARRRLPRLQAWPRLAAVGAFALFAAPAAIDLYRVHPYELSYYSALVGGLRGATTAGFERQYYDLLYLSLADWLQESYGSTPERPRPTVRVHFLPNNKEYVRTFPYLHRSGRLGRNVVISDLNGADLLVLTHERRWREYPDLYRRYHTKRVLWELAVDRVPLLTVYALKSPSAAAAWLSRRPARVDDAEALEEREVAGVTGDDLRDTAGEQGRGEEGVGDALSSEVVPRHQAQGQTGRGFVRAQQLDVAAAEVHGRNRQSLGDRNRGLESARIGDDMDQLLKDRSRESQLDVGRAQLPKEVPANGCVLGGCGHLGAHQDARIDAASDHRVKISSQTSAREGIGPVSLCPARSGISRKGSRGTRRSSRYSAIASRISSAIFRPFRRACRRNSS
jgi:hypothetical protein